MLDEGTKVHCYLGLTGPICTKVKMRDVMQSLVNVYVDFCNAFIAVCKTQSYYLYTSLDLLANNVYVYKRYQPIKPIIYFLLCL